MPGDRRGFTTAIRAFALGGKLGDRLTLVGFGRHKRRLERWAKALGVDAIVVFSEAVPGECLKPDMFDVVLFVSGNHASLSVLATTAIMRGLNVIVPEINAGSVQNLPDSRSVHRVRSYDILAYSHAVATLSWE